MITEKEILHIINLLEKDHKIPIAKTSSKLIKKHHDILLVNIISIINKNHEEFYNIIYSYHDFTFIKNQKLIDFKFTVKNFDVYMFYFLKTNKMLCKDAYEILKDNINYIKHIVLNYYYFLLTSLIGTVKRVKSKRVSSAHVVSILV